MKQEVSSITYANSTLASPPGVGTWTLGVIVSQASWWLGHCWRLANLQYVPQAPREVDMVRDGEDEGKKRTSTGEWKWAS